MWSPLCQCSEKVRLWRQCRVGVDGVLEKGEDLTVSVRNMEVTRTGAELQRSGFGP